jgi:hypothetical protein
MPESSNTDMQVEAVLADEFANERRARKQTAQDRGQMINLTNDGAAELIRRARSVEQRDIHRPTPVKLKIRPFGVTTSSVAPEGSIFGKRLEQFEQIAELLM